MDTLVTTNRAHYNRCNRIIKKKMADFSNCLNVLSNYADYLSNNPQAGDPHPLYFSKNNCEGAVWPDFTTLNQPPSGAPDFSPKLGSLWIPPNHEVVLENTKKGLSRKFCSSSTPTLIGDLSTVFYDDGIHICSSQRNRRFTTRTVQNDLTNILVKKQLPEPSQIPYSTRCWKYQMCNNLIDSVVGSQFVSSYQPGSQECDNFMNSWCNSKGGFECATVQSDADTQNINLPVCACLKDEQDLKERYCQPDSTVKSCSKDQDFQQFLPVTCFGQNCSATGYRFQRMQDQQCSVTLCQQIIQLLGDNIVSDISSSIFCGNKEFATTVSPSITPTSTSIIIQEDSIGEWIYILVGFAGFVIIVLIPLTIIIYRNSSQQSEKQDLLEQELNKKLRNLK